MSTPDETTVWIGLDIGKTEHFADVLDEAGSPLFARAVANDEADIEALIARAESLGSPALVVDQPGSLARLVLAVAARRGVPVAYVPGLVMRRAAGLYPGESKTDRRDAFVLADTGRTRRTRCTGSMPATTNSWCSCAFSTATTPTSPPMRRGSPTACGMRSPVFPRPWSAYWAPNSTLRGHGTCSPATRHRRRWPRRVAAASRGRSGSARRASPPRSPRPSPVPSAPQTVVIPGSVAMGRVIAEVATELDRTQQRRERLGVEIGELFEAHPFGLILGSLPGVGPRTGARMLAEIGDISRFANGSRLASYAGLAPVTRQSGSSIRGQTRSRRGNHRLKNAMYLSAFALAARPRLARVLRPQAAEGKKHTAAVICLARRRCDVILAMLRSREPYRTEEAPRHGSAAA